MEWVKKYLPKKSLENLSSILIMLSGVGLGLMPWRYNGLLISLVPLLVILLGASIGMWLLFKKSSPDTKKPGVFAILSALCWVYSVIAVLLLWFAPGVYGYDLAIIFNSATIITQSTLLGILFTIIALLRR